MRLVKNSSASCINSQVECFFVLAFRLAEHGESDSTLIFGDNVKSAYAVIKCNNNTYSYSVKKFGGSKKASAVIGVYWGED